jgi:pyruvate/2-oxoglutarate dehydrogenase complex dihydrolipoamide acyltransferase (E2) component
VSNDNSPGYRFVPWPGARNAVVDLLEAAHRKHNIAASWEIDFTEANARMARIRRETNVAVSLNAYLVYALGRTAAKHPIVQAVRHRRRLVLYDGVDVGTAIDYTRAGQSPRAVGARVADADTRSLAEICGEMRRLAKQDPLERPVVRWRARIARYPRWVRRLVWAWIDAHPARRRRFRGTIGLTSLNFLLDGRRPVQGFPLTPYTATLCVGSLYDRSLPDAARPGTAAFGKFLCVSLTIDHDILDGAAAAHFARTLTFFVEAADGLDDEFARELAALAPARAPRHVASR